MHLLEKFLRKMTLTIFLKYCNFGLPSITRLSNSVANYFIFLDTNLEKYMVL